MTKTEKIKETLTVLCCGIATLAFVAELVWLAVVDGIPF